MIDALTAALEEIQQRAAKVDLRPSARIADHTASAEDVPRLLAAIKAVLELHQPVTTNGGWLEGREWQECGECGPNNDCEPVIAAPGQGESFWPCPTVEAITRELKGGKA